MFLGIQIHITLSEFMLTGYVQSYSKKSLTIFLCLILINVLILTLLVHIWEEWIHLSVEIIYNISVFIVGPAALIWLNDNVKNYFKRCVFGP